MARLAALSLCLLVVVGCAAPPAPAPTPAPPARPAPSPSPSPAPLADGTIPTTDPSVHVFLWGNAGTTARDLQLARDAGFHWVKQRFEWRNIEGKARGEFEWNEPDRIVDAITQAGLRVVARVDNQPQWASTSIQWPGSAWITRRWISFSSSRMLPGQLYDDSASSASCVKPGSSTRYSSA